MENIYLTHEGLEKLRKELGHLVNTLRPIAAKELATAREKGDLSENAEYDAAREKLAGLDRQIGDMQAKFARVHILDKDSMNCDEIRILSKVTMKNLKNNTEITYTIVDPIQSDPARRLISHKSPIAKGLLGKKKGDIATITIPSGEVNFEILSIELDTEL